MARNGSDASGVLSCTSSTVTTVSPTVSVASPPVGSTVTTAGIGTTNKGDNGQLVSGSFSENIYTGYRGIFGKNSSPRTRVGPEPQNNNDDLTRSDTAADNRPGSRASSADNSSGSRASSGILRF